MQYIQILIISLLAISNIAFAESTITAKSYIVTDESGKIVIEKNADQIRSIASITKLMTAMVVLDANLPLDEMITINRYARKTYNKSIPKKITALSRRELLGLSLAKSDNMSAYLLCSSYPGGIDNCIRAMNDKAMALGLFETKFADPTGLDRNNVSTARDLVGLVTAAQSYPEIIIASTSTQIKLDTASSNKKFNNTNPLVYTNNVIVSKTGYIAAAGGCLVMLLSTDIGNRIVVLLGSRNTKTRAPEALRIALK